MLMKLAAPGQLVRDDTTELAAEAGAKRLLLFHVSDRYGGLFDDLPLSDAAFDELFGRSFPNNGAHEDTARAARAASRSAGCFCTRAVRRDEISRQRCIFSREKTSRPEPASASCAEGLSWIMDARAPEP